MANQSANGGNGFDPTIVSGIYDLVDMLAFVRIELGSAGVGPYGRPAAERLQRALQQLDRALASTKQLAARIDPDDPARRHPQA